jgi:thiol-disulfide isomerase/thioredoxin
MTLRTWTQQKLLATLHGSCPIKNRIDSHEEEQINLISIRSDRIIMAKVRFIFLLIAIIAASGCTSQTAGTLPTTVDAGKSIYSGKVLAGSSAPLIDFNKPDYDAALKTGKPVLLYFYATWCPICRAELPHLYGAFNELSTDRLIGFRVNFNDADTDDNEINLARQFGIAYQHGKVFLKDGKSILKSIETWDKSRYLSEINKVIS